MARYVQPTFIVESSAAFINNASFDSSTYFKGVVHMNPPTISLLSNPYALILESSTGNNLVVKSIKLDTMAFESVNSWDSSISNLDSSINYLNNLKVNRSGDTLTGKLIFDSTGFELDNVSILEIDTSSDGLSGSDSAFPTSGLVKSYVNSQISSGVTASNGLIELEQDIQLGGKLTRDTSIDLSGFNFKFNGLSFLSSEQSVLALNLSGNIVYTELGTMAFESASNYPTMSYVDGSLVLLNSYINNLETSIGYLDNLTQIHTEKISNLETSIGYLDLLTQDLSIYVHQLDNSVNSLIVTTQTHTTQISNINTELNNIDSSLTNLSELVQIHDISIGLIDNSVNNLVKITQIHEASIAFLETNFARGWNGLTTTDQSIGLGGILNQDTTIETSEFDLILNGNFILNGASLGSMAYEDTIDYATIYYIDGSLNIIHNDIFNLETSVGYLDILTQIHESSIAILEDALIRSWNGLTTIDHSIGLGGTLVDDTSIDTGSYDLKVKGSFTVDGSFSVVGKEFSTVYKGTFDGTLDVSLNISSSTHKLGNGPFNVTVYEDNEIVYVSTTTDSSGNVTLNWYPGSMSNNCKFIISG